MALSAHAGPHRVLQQVAPFVILSGHTNGLHALAFFADGKRVVSGSHDGTAKVWDVETGECLRTFAGHEKAVRAVAVSSDGKQIASASDDFERTHASGGTRFNPLFITEPILDEAAAMRVGFLAAGRGSTGQALDGLWGGTRSLYKRRRPPCYGGRVNKNGEGEIPIALVCKSSSLKGFPQFVLADQGFIALHGGARTFKDSQEKSI